MNQREIQLFLQDLGNRLPDKKQCYTYYDQPIRDIENSLSGLKSTLKEDGTVRNELLAKACLTNALRFCVMALYDLVPHVTDKSPGGTNNG